MCISMHCVFLHRWRTEAAAAAAADMLLIALLLMWKQCKASLQCMHTKNDKINLKLPEGRIKLKN